ncbi:hypothetical protein AB0280_15565 [Pseudarthrobacter sp902506025]|uniref:hypothetical protein n=1 Tax=Pseudarthrobacter sp. 902506025 TaxID=3155291 RepID=UPI00344BF0C5
MKTQLVILLICCGLLLLLLHVLPAPAPASAPASSDAKCKMRGELPDPVCTPGVINPKVTQANIQQTICVSGWSSSIRPVTSYTNALKLQQMKEYGFTDSPSKYEQDHLVSISLGGHPTDPKNLWPQPDAAPNPKDAVENKLRAKVCSGAMSLATAQQRIATDWRTASN